MVTLLHRPIVLNVLGFAMLVLCLVAVAEVNVVPYSILGATDAPARSSWEYVRRSAPDMALNLPGDNWGGLPGSLSGPTAAAGTATGIGVDPNTGEWLLT